MTDTNNENSSVSSNKLDIIGASADVLSSERSLDTVHSRASTGTVSYENVVASNQPSFVMDDVTCERPEESVVEEENEFELDSEDFGNFEDAMDNLHLNLEEKSSSKEDSRREDLKENENFNRFDASLNENNRETESSAEESDINVINEELLKEKESQLTDEDKLERRTESRRLKDEGNDRFKNNNYDGAIESYSNALITCLLTHAEDRAIIYSNRAATYMKMKKYDEAIADSSKALEFNPDYMKALLRRAELYERVEKYDDALDDYKKALERDPSLHQARAACLRLPDQINERNEKMKTEMLGKLKDLGNLVLRPFGLSTNNFKLQQDPNTGSYNISFQQQQP